MRPNDQVERPCGTAICEALYKSRPLQPIVRRPAASATASKGRRLLVRMGSPTSPEPSCERPPQGERCCQECDANSQVEESIPCRGRERIQKNRVARAGAGSQHIQDSE